MASSSSTPHKHDQKLKSAVEAVEEKESVKNPPPYNSKIYICLSCKGAFPTPHALGGHRTTHKEENQKVEMQQQNHENDNSQNGSGSTQSKTLISERKKKSAEERKKKIADSLIPKKKNKEIRKTWEGVATKRKRSS
ncbi:uncharacterized protein LOC17875832 [Capsella rubella]|uniref:uncharacterized protein LOC17875832 n=1 Tax=Capsella rubella TaxID=81985 RepID=UPI000CD545E8|nr:uncharacterized protein LOC17875832 [Capsella rubella]